MELMEVQKEAKRRSAGKRGFGYFMEMGLGKTLTSQSDFLDQVDAGLSDRGLVVCPNSFKSGWVEDTNKHKLGINQCVWDSGSSHMAAWLRRDSNAPRQLIINYEAIRSPDVMKFLELYFKDRSVFTSFDESIQLKQYDSQQTKQGIEIGKMSRFIRCLSGKPTTQGSHDLWGQLRAMREITGHNYFAFKNNFTQSGGFKGKKVIGNKNEEELQELLRPIAFYAKKADWSDIPPKLFTQREYLMTKEMRSMFDSMYQEFVLWLNDEEFVEVDAAITKYIKLAQIQAGFIIDETGKVHELVTPKNNPRIRLLRDIVDTEIVGKTLVPYVFKYTRETLMSAFGDLNPAYIRGGMTPDEIDFQKRRFNEDPSCRIMFLQTRASKYGHTLLGGAEPENRCSSMVFYENTYSLDDRSQIEDRNNRWGQTADHCLYIDLIGTIVDMNMVKSLVDKEERFQSVFNPLRTRPV